MRIVVFGTGGHAGSEVVAGASSRGHEVSPTVRDAAKGAGLPESVDVVPADITDPALVKGLAGRADALVIPQGVLAPRC